MVADHGRERVFRLLARELQQIGQHCGRAVDLASSEESADVEAFFSDAGLLFSEAQARG
jgi:hypothetical protein